MSRFSITVDKANDRMIVRPIETRQGQVSRSIFGSRREHKIFDRQPLQAA